MERLSEKPRVRTNHITIRQRLIATSTNADRLGQPFMSLLHPPVLILPRKRTLHYQREVEPASLGAHELLPLVTF